MTIAVPVGTVTTWTFHADGTEQTLTVPRHDGPIRIRSAGGVGSNGGVGSTATGGAGGAAEGWATVSAGAVIAVFPGENGYTGGATPSDLAGGLGTGTPGLFSGTGGAGTRVKIAGSTVMIVGGGGGGGGGTYGSNGGNGGNGASTDGSADTNSASGRGGTSSAGGAGGTGHDMSGAITSGGAGSSGVGGNAVSDWITTGGGGGGYYGGGGGAVHWFAWDGENVLGRGGGGSTWISPTLTDVTSTGPKSYGSVEITADVIPWRPRAHLGLVAVAH